MILTRPWIPIFLAGCSWAQVALGQTGGEPAGTPGSPAGQPGQPSQPSQRLNPNTPGAPRPPGSPAPAAPTGPQGPANPFAPPPGTTPTTPAPGNEPPPLPESPGRAPSTAPSPNDPFGFGQPGVLPPGQPGQPGQPSQPGSPFAPRTGPGASSNFGADLPRNATPPGETGSDTETGATKPRDEGVTFTAPGFYGSGTQTFTSGQGRFTRPRFRYSVSASMGFDDNIFQTTKDPQGLDDQVIVEVIPAEPEISTIETETTTTLVFTGGAFVPRFRTTQRKVILRPAVPERTIETVIPGFTPAERQSSVISSIDGNIDVQWVKSRSLFTLDARAGVEYYWNRDNDPLDYNGSLSATYIRRLTSRAQFTGNLSLVHQTSPDYSQVNLQTTTNQTDDDYAYTTANFKLDLSYRWASRFSTTSSFVASSIIYGGNRSANSYYELSLGNEFRYMASRRLSYLAELRYTDLSYLDIDTQNSATILLLLGFEYRLSQRLSGVLRVGESIRSYQQGEKASSPYGELSATYALNRKNQFTLSGRYGFEQGSTPQVSNIVTRFSLGYTRLFSPRFTTSLTLNYADNAYTFTNAGLDSQSNTTTYDMGLSGRYIFSRKFSMSARYSYTNQVTDTGFSDFDRGRFFLTGQYEF